MAKNLILCLISTRCAQIRAAKIFFKRLSSSVSRYYGQLSLFTISKKNNDPILRKFSDWQTDGQTDRRTRVIL